MAKDKPIFTPISEEYADRLIAIAKKERTMTAREPDADLEACARALLGTVDNPGRTWETVGLETRTSILAEARACLLASPLLRDAMRLLMGGSDISGEDQIHLMLDIQTRYARLTAARQRDGEDDEGSR